MFLLYYGGNYLVVSLLDESQSAALALICDREKEIHEFKAQEYWTIDVQFKEKNTNSDKHISLSSHLTHFDSKKLNQLSVSSSVEAKDIEERINLSEFEVIGSKPSKLRRNPPTPFITSARCCKQVELYSIIHNESCTKAV